VAFGGSVRVSPGLLGKTYGFKESIAIWTAYAAKKTCGSGDSYKN
jgi:hypothetical protein